MCTPTESDSFHRGARALLPGSIASWTADRLSTTASTPSAVSGFLDMLGGALQVEGDGCLRLYALGQQQPLRNPVDREGSLRAQFHGGKKSHEPDGSAPDDGNCAARSGSGALGSEKPGSKNIAGKQSLLLGLAPPGPSRASSRQGALERTLPGSRGDRPLSRPSRRVGRSRNEP